MNADEWLRVWRVEGGNPSVRYATYRALKREGRLDDWPQGSKAGRIVFRRLALGSDGRWHEPWRWFGGTIAKPTQIICPWMFPNAMVAVAAGGIETRCVENPSVCMCVAWDLRRLECRGYGVSLPHGVVRIENAE